jgi:flagellar hook-associated protein 1 FlgK
MSSSFSGLEVGKRGLQTHQKALDVTSQNMTNASTPGYSRQRAEITATDPFGYPAFNREQTAGQVGTGVNVTAVIRIRDEFIDGRVQTEKSTQGRWKGRQDMLNQMELVVNEPSDSNIRTYSDSFWKSLEELSTNPSESSVRSNLREQATSLADEIKHNYSQYQDMRTNVNEQVKDQVNQINNIASKIAALNDQIGKITPLGDRPNDLLDQRGIYVEQLSQLINFTSLTDRDGRLNISVGGKPLVLGSLTTKIGEIPDRDGIVSLAWMNPNGVTISDQALEIHGGSLKGLMEIRDQDLPNMMHNLDKFASTLINQVNAIHQKGYGIDTPPSHGISFFSGIDAKTIDISDNIKMDLNKIAASDVGVEGSGTGAEGNNAIALQLAALKQNKIFNNGTTTMGDFLGAVVAQLGTDSQNAKTQFDSQDLLITNLDTRREQVCGVSYDEEMTNMVEYQHGYNAAAKVITTMDEMLDVIVNKLKV